MNKSWIRNCCHVVERKHKDGKESLAKKDNLLAGILGCAFN